MANSVSGDDTKCAPTSKYEDGSCISTDVLIEMAKAYNTENENKIEINTTQSTLHPNSYKKYLLNEFSNRLKNVCNRQTCWVKQKFTKHMNNAMKEELQKKTFRPIGPFGKFEWLNTININEVLGQYEYKYNDFKKK